MTDQTASNRQDEPIHPHTPADDKEEVYFEGSPLLRGDLGRLFIAAVIAALLVAIPILNSRFGWFPMRPWVWLIFIGLAIVCLLIPIIMIRTVRYRITNYRIDFERGLLSKNIDTLELWHVEDIHFHQSLLDRLVNTGDITILSHDDTTPRLHLNGVPNPRPLFENLKQRIIAVKRQRGVIKMDTGN
jgi:membrane protein YdbS with pleckstrin-like domain